MAEAEGEKMKRFNLTFEVRRLIMGIVTIFQTPKRDKHRGESRFFGGKPRVFYPVCHTKKFFNFGGKFL